ncbi:hypothetical protein KKF61_03115 [Patescibacteria group bacterium]|nr:hypothetical protein [Patescibacteria group bacterium]MBU0964006.1 hypothetical protein [Patescibacteria group bacterium]
MPNMNRKTLFIIVGVVVVIVVILALVVLWIYANRTEPGPVNGNTASTNTNTPTIVVNASANTNAVQPANVNAAVDEELALIRLANIFVERFGSYSSEADFQNLIDLKKYMTRTMQSWTDDYIKVEQAKFASQGFSSVVSQVVSTYLTNLEGIKASLQVTTQRQDTSADVNASSDPYYQNIILEMVKEGTDWLVNVATWQVKGEIPSLTNTNTADTNSATANTNSAEDSFMEFINNPTPAE